MKKQFVAVLLIITVLCALCGCAAGAGELTATELWTAVESAAPPETLPVMMDIDAAALRTYYGLGEDEVREYVGQMPLLNVSATEILIVHAQKKHVETVKQALNTRLERLSETWSGGETTQYVIVLSGRVVENGGWLMLVVAEKTEEIVNAFNACFEGK